MNKDEQLIKKRLIELANVSYNRNIPVFSDFLNLNEQNIYYNISKELMPPIAQKAVGGYNLAERKLIAFFPQDMEEYIAYPYELVAIRPLNSKFADNLSHRDFLGALMNLGIDRCKLGDIIVNDKEAFLFCISSIAPYILENLTRIKNTSVMAVRTENENIVFEPEYEEIQGTVSSLRLDCILALAYNSSRSKLTSYITEGKVFVNGKLITSNGYSIKENDIISVRGLGKFKYLKTISTTKKSKFLVLLNKYI